MSRTTGKPSSKKSWAAIAVVVALGGYLIYMQVTKLDRAIDGSRYLPSSEELAVLREHAEDPRVQQLAARWIGRSFDNFGQATLARYAAAADAIFSVHPHAPDADFVGDVIKVAAGLQRPEYTSWIAGYGSSPDAMRALVQAARTVRPSSTSEDSVSALLMDELERLGPTVDQEVIEAVFRIAVDFGNPRALAFVERGFPPNGEPLRLGDHPPGDSRVLSYVWHELERMGERGFSTNAKLNPIRLALVRNAPAELDSLAGVVLDLFAHRSYWGYAEIARDMGPAFRTALREQVRTAETNRQRAAGMQLLAVSGPAGRATSLAVLDYLGERTAPDAASSNAPAASVVNAEISYAVRALAALGRQSLPPIARWLDPEDGHARFAVVRAASTVDPAALAVALEQRLAREPGSLSCDKRTKDGMVAGPASCDVQRVAMSGLARKGPSPLIDRFFMRVLSDPVEKTRDIAVRTLTSRLDAEGFVSSLFAFMVRKNRFNVKELETYEKALLTYDDVGDAMAGRLGQELVRAGGGPQTIYWAVKVLALDVLEQRGQANAIPALRVLTTDPGKYVWTSSSENPVTGEITVRDSEEIAYADRAREAISAIENRAG